MSSNKGIQWGIAMVISGTFSTVLMKIQYSILAEGNEECWDPSTAQMTKVCPFNKPWFGVLEMKVAMASCLLYLYGRKAISNRKLLETPIFPRTRQRPGTKLSSESYGLLQGQKLGQNGEEISWKTIFALLFPSLLDLLQTVLGNIGLLWVSSSVYQMARGSMIIFSALLSVHYMKKKLEGFHYVSMILVSISVVLVGYADILKQSLTDEGHSSSFEQMLGLFLIVLAQFLCAVQIVFEEHIMTSLNVPPVMLVGYEGLWGVVFYVLLIPLLSLTPASTSSYSKIWHEDFMDSLVQISNSPALVGLILAYIVAVCLLNVTGNHVTKLLNAIVRSILEAVRTLGVWVAGLFIYYVMDWRGSDSPGEAWSVWSWIEMAGFVLMVYGTLAYKKMVRIPIAALYRDDLSKSPYRSPFIMSSRHK